MTTKKFQSVDKKVDIDLESTIQEMKLEADDLNKRLYNVQIEQIKPIREQNIVQVAEIEELRKIIEDLGHQTDNVDIASKKSSVKHVTPLSRNLEDPLKEAKEEMRDYIDEIFKRTEIDQKRKLTDLENQIKREARTNQSPTGTGHGRGAQA